MEGSSAARQRTEQPCRPPPTGPQAAGVCEAPLGLPPLCTELLSRRPRCPLSLGAAKAFISVHTSSQSRGQPNRKEQRRWNHRQTYGAGTAPGELTSQRSPRQRVSSLRWGSPATFMKRRHQDPGPELEGTGTPGCVSPGFRPCIHC